MKDYKHYLTDDCFVDEFEIPGKLILKACDPQHGHSFVLFTCATEKEMIEYLKKHFKT